MNERFSDRSKRFFSGYDVLVLACILSIVNDILLVKKAILPVNSKGVKELIIKAFFIPIAHVFYPDVLSLFDYLYLLYLTLQFAEGDEDMNDANETLKSVSGFRVGKKDLALRRRELLVDSGLAEIKRESTLRGASDCLEPLESFRIRFSNETPRFALIPQRGKRKGEKPHIQ
ncbi:hypothetical protein Tco_0483888 [Tanacetum coccineum]